jgi:transposase
MMVPTDSLPDDPGTLKAMLLAERVRAERLEQIIKEMQRHRFGRRAETLPEDQLLLGLEEVEQTAAGEEADHEAKSPAEREARASKRRANRGSLPSHLPRVEMMVDVQDQSCPCCRGALHVIGEDRAERLDIVPAQFRVLVIRRPKYACRACEDAVVQAPAPARLIEGGIPTEATIAQVLVSKYADHLPLYRQAQIYARQGVNLDRSTLADWVGRAAFLLRPVHERLLAILKASTNSLQTRPRRRYSIQAADEPRPGSSSPMRATIVPGAGPIRPASPMSMLRTARPRVRSLISPASSACCRSTATAAIAYWPKETP